MCRGVHTVKKYLVIHCSDTPNDRDVKTEEIHQWHLDRGWDGIGYNLVIERNGQWQAGRPDYWVGSHVKGHNSESIGICLVGRDEFTDLQMETLDSYIEYYTARYPCIEVVGHRDLDSNKTCPNFDVRHYLSTGEVKA
jgi:N-acetylmuramoyl-L-alanine amidase